VLTDPDRHRRIDRIPHHVRLILAGGLQCGADAIRQAGDGAQAGKFSPANLNPVTNEAQNNVLRGRLLQNLFDTKRGGVVEDRWRYGRVLGPLKPAPLLMVTERL